MANIFLFAGLICGILFATLGMAGLRTQLMYMQDTVSIIQTDIGNLQSNIKKTLEKEASLIEDYRIEVVSTDFAAGTYDVRVSVIPKEYTDATKTSIFFGAQEYVLPLNGFEYQGMITLPLDVSYDGNITFLFINDDKKSTEVLRDYVGYQTSLAKVVTAVLEENAKYDKEQFSLDTNLKLSIQGEDDFVFESVALMIAYNEEEVYNESLLAEELGAVGQLELEVPIEFEQDMEAEDTVRVWIRAVTQQGYTFEYDIIQATASIDEENEDAEVVIVPEETKPRIYDEQNVVLELN